MQQKFINNSENTMNSFSSSSIVGFLDQVLNPRYKDVDFEPLLDEFCKIAIDINLVDSLSPELQNKEALKDHIRSIVQDKGDLLLNATYYDAKTGQGKEAIYHSYQVARLVMAATLDKAVYRESEPDLSEESLQKIFLLE